MATTRMYEGRPLLRGLSTICIMPERSRFMQEYMQGSNHWDMQGDWQRVGEDIRASVEAVRMKYGKR